MKKWKTISTKTLLEHPRMNIYEDDILLPHDNIIKYIRYTDNDGAMAICTRGDEILIQREYSYPPNLFMYEFPGGGMEKDEDPVDAAIRELQEETGYTSTTGEYLGYYYKDNRRTNSKMHVVYIKDPLTAEKIGGDIQEDITPEWVKISKLRQMIGKGEITNVSILTGLALYDNRRV